jgi:DNA-binding winged helix-turn-helix (wHTH) protein/tetratricopeptide (TPR) repeat protein
MITAMGPYSFGPFSLDPVRCVLSRGKDVLPVGPKAVALLLALVERAGEPVTKDELLERVWSDSFVEEANLSVQVSTLRKAIGVQPDGRPWIETLSRRGYRFIGDVTRSAAQTPRSLAVLPFTSVNPQPDEDYLGTGLADALITRLSAIGGIVVRPTTAILPYAKGDRPARQAVRELGVGCALEGRFQREGQRIRLTAQLVGGEGGVLWAGTFEEPFTNLLDLQDRLAERLAGALSLRWGSEEEDWAQRRRPSNEAAHHAYLRGRYFWNKQTDPWLERARDAFQEAIAADPSHAPSHAGLADAYTMMGIYGRLRPDDLRARAGQAAQRGIEIQPDLPEGHLALAFARLFGDWDWDGAEQHLRRAVDLAPRVSAHRQWFGLFLGLRGKTVRAMAELVRARSFDPLSLTAHTALSVLHYLTGRSADAMAEPDGALDLEPDFAFGHWARALAYFQQGEFSKAIAAQQRVVDLAGRGPLMVSLLAQFNAAAGLHDEARRLMATLAPAADVYVSPYRVASVELLLGDRDAAFAQLDRGCAERDPLMVLARVDPTLAPLRNDKRYARVLRCVGG